MWVLCSSRPVQFFGVLARVLGIMAGVRFKNAEDLPDGIASSVGGAWAPQEASRTLKSNIFCYFEAEAAQYP